METTEIILRNNGTLTERIIRERELDAGQSVLDVLTSKVTRTLRNCCPARPPRSSPTR